MYYTNIRLSRFGGWQPVTEFTVDKRGDCPIFLRHPAHLQVFQIMGGRHHKYLLPCAVLGCERKLSLELSCNLRRPSQRMIDLGA